MVALLLFWPSIFSTLKFDLAHVVDSYLFVPTINSSGEYYPVLNAGWTLSYEMYFYAIFAVLLMLSASVSVLFTGTLFAASVIAGLLNPPTGAVSYMLTHQLLLEFVAGECIGLWFIRGGRFSPRVSLALLVSVLAFYAYHIVYGPLGLGRFIDRGLPAVGLIFALLSLERNNQVSFPDWLKKMGDSSYSLYLIHTMCIAIFFKICEFLGIIGRLPADIVMLVGVLCALIGAHVTYLILERPITVGLVRAWRFWRGRRVVAAS
jgi:peptidoglycan/LPS O-acetylase OafA/YrhL